MQLLKEYRRELFLALMVVSLLDILLWFFKTQTALFLAMFLIFPLWFFYILFFVEEEEKKEAD